MNKKQLKLGDQVRRAVDASGKSRYAICKALGMEQSLMSRFMSRKGGLSMANFEALADLLGLDVVARGPQSATPRRRPGRPRKAR